MVAPDTEIYVKGQATDHLNIKFLSSQVIRWIGTCEYIEAGTKKKFEV